MKTPKVDTSGSIAASNAIAEAQKAATNLQKNFSADLKNENVAQVTPGGMAEDAAQVSSVRKKRTAGGLASQLGVNV